MRGSSESVPTRLASLLPSAEYIGCRRYCSAAARRTLTVIVGWKIARPVLLLPRIPLRYALPGRVSKAGCQSPATARVRQQKENGRASGTSLPPVARNRQGAAAKREAGCIRKYPQLSQLPYVVEWAKALESPPGQAPVTGAASVPDEVRNAAAKPFSLDTIKKRFLFFLGKIERGFCPRGGAAKLPGFPGTTAPLARGKNPPPITSRRPAASPVPPPV